MHSKEKMAASLEKLKQAHQQAIERVVCSGGGAKGVVYAGSYKAMKDTGVYKGVQEFSGASAGAITAAFMALGMSPNTFRERLLTTNLKDLMGNPVGKILGKNPPGISFITKDGKLMEQFLRQNIIETVQSSLQGIKDFGKANEDPEFNKLILKLNSENPRITFADLALLNHHFPNDFKKLTLPAVKFPGGEVQIFNSELTPDVEIALACRASASIPVVLEPVEIEINGVKQKFVDGGLYDNLPTDYFDKNAKGEFLPNQKPMQTMVFAFGEGLDNSQNQVFQALYGQRWDEAITNEFLQDLLGSAFKRCKKLLEPGEKLDSPEAEAKLIMQSVKLGLDKLIADKKITSDEAKVVMDAMNQAVRQVLLKPQENQDFWQAYKGAKKSETKLGILVEFVKQIMKPILYKAGFVERLKRDVLIELLGDLQAPYKNTGQKEIGYQKLRSEYPLRTVELRVGDIKTTDFGQATRLARVMDSLGYLDTVNHITNHELHDPQVFDADQFYVDLVKKFECIYEATLASSGKDPQKSVLLREINELKIKLKAGRVDISEAEINRQVYQFIKDKVESRLDSMEAFALARTVEFHNKTINAEQLFKETYEEGFKRSSIFSVSNITGGSIFRSSTLHEALKDKDMFELHAKQGNRGVQTRTDKVFTALSKLTDFAQEAQSYTMNKDDVNENDVIIDISPKS